MGQIVGLKAKPKRCNLNKLSQLGTPAAGEHILVSSDNSMNAAGQGNFDCYIVGDGTTAAEDLLLLPTNDGVYDISARHSGATYVDLAAALGTNGANVPAGVRRGGMSVKFVQSSDNKYVQYRYLLEYANTTAGNNDFIFVGNWKNIEEELQDFENDIAQYVEPVNLFNKDSSLLVIGKFIQGSGDYHSLSGSCVTHPISFKYGEKFTFPVFPGYYGQNARVVRICNSDGTLRTGVIFASDNGDGTATAYFNNSDLPSGYFCVNCKQSELDSFMVVKGEIIPSYSPYFEPKWKIKENALPNIIDTTLSVAGKAADAEVVGDRINETKESLIEYEDAISKKVYPTNLFNKNSLLNHADVKVSYRGGFETLSGSTVSHPIKIEVGKTYSFKWSAGWYGASTNCIVRLCDANGNLIEGVTGISSTASSDNSYGTFTVPDIWEGYDYCCVNVRTNDIGSMIFAEGETLPVYSDYFEPYWQIKNSALPSDLPLPLKAEVNPLYGKKAAFTGDSICYGQGASGGYAKIIGEENNMTISNIGVAGGTLCSGTNRFCISASVDNMPEDYDYYIVEGGVNDASQEHGETLGVLSSGYNATLDTTTLYGAMESLCKKLQLNFKGKKYGFIFPHNTYGDTSVWNTGWRDAMKICLKKWGIPYLDLSEECAQLRNLDALRIYTANSDGWHPNEDGYRRYYVPKIEAWMKTL